MTTSIPLKFGPHHAQGGSETGKWLKLVPVVAKAVDSDLGALIEARPGTLTIGRCVDVGKLGGQGFDFNRQRLNQTADEAAAQYVAFLAPTIKSNPWIQVWEGPNEQAFKDTDTDADRQTTMLWYAEFCYQFARRLHDLGKRAGLGSWSTGNPRREFDLMRYYGRALQACQDFGAFACRHDYGPLAEPGGLRIDYDNAEFEKLGFRGIQQIVTEGGMDSVGWVANAAAWRRYYGTMDRYWNELLKPWLDQLSVRPYCLGVCIFTDGGGWKDFDISGTDIVARLAAYTPPLAATVALPPNSAQPAAQVVSSSMVTNPAAPMLAIATRLGLHGRADGRMQPADFQAVRDARIEAVKLMSTADPADFDRMKAIDPNMFIMVRCFADFHNRVLPAQDFAHSMAGDLAPFYAKGIRHFEIHNEPNLTGEGQIFPGQTGTWADGAGFGQWFSTVKAQLSQTFRESKWGWPGLSPGDDIHLIRQNADRFLTEAGSAPASADWIGIHAYWIDDDGLQAAIDSVAAYAKRFPGHTLYVTEFANPDKAVDMAIKGRQYLAFWQGMRTLPVAAVFSFVSSASNPDFAAQAWRDEGGQLSAIPGIVGARTVLTARWWDAWPSGDFTATRRLAVPPAPVEIVDGSGQPLVPPVSRQNGMDVFERQGDLLRVFDQPLHGQVWWVRAADVQPELAYINDLPVTPAPTPPPPAAAPPTTTPAPTPEGANGIQTLLFQMHKTTGAPNESIIFDFKVVNNTSSAISYGILAAHTDQGVTADSWHDPLLPGQVLSWTDHINFPNPGTYYVYLGICYSSHDACQTGGAPWTRLSPSIAVTIG